MSMDWFRYVVLAEQFAAAIQQAKAQGKAGVFQIILKPAEHSADPDEIVVATCAGSFAGVRLPALRRRIAG